MFSGLLSIIDWKALYTLSVIGIFLIPALVFVVLHIKVSLVLVVDVDNTFLHVYIFHCQTAQFRYPHPCMEENEHTLVVLGVYRVIRNEFQESSHILSCKKVVNPTPARKATPFER